MDGFVTRQSVAESSGSELKMPYSRDDGKVRVVLRSGCSDSPHVILSASTVVGVVGTGIISGGETLGRVARM